MSKSLSAGVVIFNERGDILLCHATETHHWDIPKGMGDPGERASDTALRELREETSIVMPVARLTDLGIFAYRRDKVLHLFAMRAAPGEIVPEDCHCVSLFPSRRTGLDIPEMDDFAWVAPAAVAQFASGSLTRLFETSLPLDALFTRLAADSSDA